MSTGQPKRRKGAVQGTADLPARMISAALSGFASVELPIATTVPSFPSWAKTKLPPGLRAMISLGAPAPCWRGLKPEGVMTEVRSRALDLNFR